MPGSHAETHPVPLGPGLLLLPLQTRLDRSPSRPSFHAHRGGGRSKTGDERPGPFDIENLFFDLRMICARSR
jgi:hypothetical protein